MKQVEFQGLANGGSAANLQALFKIYPWLPQALEGGELSVVWIFAAPEICTNWFSEEDCSEGRIVLVKDRKVLKMVGLDEVRSRRSTLGLEEPFVNSPQTEIKGAEDACAVVRMYWEDDPKGGGRKKWVVAEIFVCPPGKTFASFETVQDWLAEANTKIGG